MRGKLTYSVSETELAYAAGIIDGEGCVEIRFNNSKFERHAKGTTSRISVSQAEPRYELLEWLQRKFGGSIFEHNRTDREPTHNKSRKWVTQANQAADFCKLILPYLLLKKRQAELIIEHQATKNQVNAGKSTSGIRISEEIISKREAQIEECARLNKRGVIPCQSGTPTEQKKVQAPDSTMGK